jgi:hypothetical protein
VARQTFNSSYDTITPEFGKQEVIRAANWLAIVSVGETSPLHSLTTSAMRELPEKLGFTNILPFVYCAGIHLSDPVSLTATSEKKTCRGLPSAVPRCSVENRIGPAFL